VNRRARLADILVESLDAEALTHIDRLWLSEAKRRRDEERAGNVKTIPGEEALRSVRFPAPTRTIHELTRKPHPTG